MSEKRRGLGRGLGALIPPAPTPAADSDRPVDVFFPSGASSEADIQIRAKSLYNGEEDRAPDSGWLKVPYKP